MLGVPFAEKQICSEDWLGANNGLDWSIYVCFALKKISILRTFQCHFAPMEEIT